MKSKGFTLVELLAVLVIMAIIATIGGVGMVALSNAINNYMWESTVNLIEAGAISYGEDHQGALQKISETCEVDGEAKSSCIKVSVQTLIDKNYVSTKEKDQDNNKVLINPTKDKSESGYYVDAKNEYVYIYIENNVVYALYVGYIETGGE